MAPRRAISWAIGRKPGRNLFRGKIAHPRVPRFVRLDPARVELRFVKRLGHVRLNALDVLRRCRSFWFARWLDRPGSEQSLVEQIFLIPVRRFRVVERAFPSTIGLTPALQRPPPKLRHFGNRD